MYFGYFWAIKQITDKATSAGVPFDSFLASPTVTEAENILYSVGWFQTEIDEGGVEQYFANGSKEEFDSLVKALTLVSANETAKAIGKCATAQLKYNTLSAPSESDEEKLAEKIQNIWDDVTEDYISKAVSYVRNVLLPVN